MFKQKSYTNETSFPFWDPISHTQSIMKPNNRATEADSPNFKSQLGVRTRNEIWQNTKEIGGLTQRRDSDVRSNVLAKRRHLCRDIESSIKLLSKQCLPVLHGIQHSRQPISYYYDLLSVLYREFDEKRPAALFWRQPSLTTK